MARIATPFGPKTTAAEVARGIDLSGRAVVVTGASSGIGVETARAMALTGARVTLAVRNDALGSKVAHEIAAATGNRNVRAAPLDLSDLDSIREFSRAWEGQLHVLVCNAGVMALPLQRTARGWEMQFATNHLGAFALTGLLLPALVARPGSRVVAVSSIAARSGHIDFADPMGERRYDAWAAYNQSKLANLLFISELTRRLRRAALKLTAVAAHPGASVTGLFSTPGGGFFIKRVVSPLMMRFLFQSASAGALPILHAATAVDAVPGGYYGPSGPREMQGPPAPAAVPPQARDAEVAQRLWQLSEQLTGVVFP